MATLRIFLNGETREIPSGISLDRLLDHFSLPKQRIAVEVNKNVIRRNCWSETIVNSNDRVEVVHFVGGG